MTLEADVDDSRPTQPVSMGFMLAYVLTVFAIYMALFAPLLATIPVKIGEISAAGSKAVDLGTVLAPGALAALVAAPIFGAISDRTKSRFGRRKLWIVFGIGLMLIGLVLMALATTLAAIGLGWFLVQIGANAAMAANNENGGAIFDHGSGGIVLLRAA